MVPGGEGSQSEHYWLTLDSYPIPYLPYHVPGLPVVRQTCKRRVGEARPCGEPQGPTEVMDWPRVQVGQGVVLPLVILTLPSTVPWVPLTGLGHPRG